MIDLKVKCSRCRNVHMESERKQQPSHEWRGSYDHVCPRCGCKTYYRLDEESSQ